MAEKHTVEDVLALYAQTEEGAAHIAEQGKMRLVSAKKAPLVPVNNTSSQTELMHAAFAALVQEALSRPTMKEAHDMYKELLQDELHDSGLGFLEIPLESLPTGGIFYPEGTRIFVRAASGGEIRHWSMSDETDVNSIDDALTYIIQRCMRISFPTGRGDWKQLKELDRFYIILAIRDFTYTDGNNELRIKVNENKEVPVHKDNISFIEISDKMLKYYNNEKRCFTFPVKNPTVGSIDIYMPCVGVTQWLKDYMRRKQQRQEQFDQDFITIAPMLINDYTKLNDSSYAALLRETMNWGPYEWSLVSKVKSILQDSITPKLTYIDEGGAEAETPLNFQGGIKAIFNINLDEEFDF